MAYDSIRLPVCLNKKLKKKFLRINYRPNILHDFLRDLRMKSFKKKQKITYFYNVFFFKFLK